MLQNERGHEQEVSHYLDEVRSVHEEVIERDTAHKSRVAGRYNRGVREKAHYNGGLVMLHQKGERWKLAARWRGPFILLSSCDEDAEVSYKIGQLGGKHIKG